MAPLLKGKLHPAAGGPPILLRQTWQAPPQPFTALTESFSSALDAGKWTQFASPVVASGQLQIVPVSAYDDITTTDRYTLVGNSVSCQFVQAPNASALNTTMEMHVGSSTDAVYVLWYQSTLIFRERVASSNSDTSIAYVPATHRYVRISESGGTINWDTSVDGTTWTNRRTKVSTLDLSHAQLRLTAGTFAGDVSTGTAIFDNVNLAEVAATATGSITLDGTATAKAAATASGSLTLAGAANWVVPSVTGSLALSGTANWTAPTSTGSITLAGSVTAQAAATAAGSLTLGGTATAQAAGIPTGSITLGGTATAAGAATATGSITLNGAASAAGAATAIGSITLDGSATAGLPNSATGSITLDATAAAQAAATATGSITLDGAGLAGALTTVAGSLDLAATATAVSGDTPVIVGGGGGNTQYPIWPQNPYPQQQEPPKKKPKPTPAVAFGSLSLTATAVAVGIPYPLTVEGHNNNVLELV